MVEMHLVPGIECACGQSTGWPSGKVPIPARYARYHRKVFPGVLLRGDGGAGGVQPFVAIRVVGVPVAVDQVPDRVLADGIKRSRNSGLRYGETGVDEELSVFAGQNRDVSSRALEDGNISPQRVNADGCGRGR